MTQKNKLRRMRQNLLLSFGLSALLVGGVYVLLGFWPFGDNTILTGDLNGQYVNYITDMWRRVQEGGFFYSFAKLCGGSTLGLFAYYMNSPFNLLYLLFPVSMVPAVAQIMFLLRVALTGTACCLFLQKHLNSHSRLLPVISQGYALCAFCVVYNQNIIWMDVVLLAPLVLWALEKLVDQGNHWPFLGLVWLAVFLNFYTAWALCLFCTLYFLYYWVVSERLLQRSGRLFLGRLGRFASAGALAAGGALVLLWPALSEIQQTKGALFETAFSLKPQFSLAELPYQLFLGNFFWQDVTNGLPQIYCGVFCAVLALAFFAGRFALREKLAAGGILAALVLSFWLSGMDIVWHGFKEPVWFPYRYSFLFSLFLVLLAARALVGARPKTWVLALCAGVGAAFLAGYALTAGEEFSVMKLAVTGAVWLGSLACLWLLGGKRTAIMLGTVGFLGLAAGDMALNSYLSLRKFESYTYSGFQQFYQQGSQVVSELRALDSGLYRIEKNFMRTLNDPMLFGYWGISHFSSVKASLAKPLLEQLGYVNYSIYGWGSTAVADSLLGIRYLYSDGSRAVPDHYQPLALNTELAVYENPYALPLAYVGSRDALAVEPAAFGDTFAMQNKMLQALVPGAEAPLVKAEQVEFEENAKGIKLYFTAAETGPCYLAIPGTDQYLPADVKVNGQLLGEYFTGDSLGGVFPLGRFEKGQRVYLELGFEDTPEYRAQIQLYSLKEQALESAVHQMQAASPQTLSVREGGSIDAVAVGGQNADLLVLPFAYEDEQHWKLTVNGAPATLECVFGGLMGVRLQQGENTISLRYAHPGAVPGAVASCLSGAGALAWFWVEKRRKERPTKEKTL